MGSPLRQAHAQALRAMGLPHFAYTVSATVGVLRCTGSARSAAAAPVPTILLRPPMPGSPPPLVDKPSAPTRAAPPAEFPDRGRATLPLAREFLPAHAFSPVPRVRACASTRSAVAPQRCVSR